MWGKNDWDVMLEYGKTLAWSCYINTRVLPGGGGYKVASDYRWQGVFYLKLGEEEFMNSIPLCLVCHAYASNGGINAHGNEVEECVSGLYWASVAKDGWGFDGPNGMFRSIAHVYDVLYFECLCIWVTTMSNWRWLSGQGDR